MQVTSELETSQGKDIVFFDLLADVLTSLAFEETLPSRLGLGLQSGEGKVVLR